MRIFPALLLLAAAPAAVLCAPGGVLEKVVRIQVGPTVIEHPESVQDPAAGTLVRYNLRAALQETRIAEGDAPVRAHIVLDEFTVESQTKRVLGSTTGRSVSTVVGRLVIADAGGKELASVPLRVRGSVALISGGGSTAKAGEGASDFEKTLIEDIEGLR